MHELSTSVYQIRGHIKGKTLLPFPQVGEFLSQGSLGSGNAIITTTWYVQFCLADIQLKRRYLISDYIYLLTARGSSYCRRRTARSRIKWGRMRHDIEEQHRRNNNKMGLPNRWGIGINWNLIHHKILAIDIIYFKWNSKGQLFIFLKGIEQRFCWGVEPPKFLSGTYDRG